jgi:TRAP-type uncharacterized transport system fused permease subunit
LARCPSAGAGGFFIQLAFALLGKYRGGPAKKSWVMHSLTVTDARGVSCEIMDRE